MDRTRLTIRKPWVVLSAAIALVFAIQLLTLRLDPPIFQDEVQIIDYGRTALDPSSDWAITWNVQQSIPVLTISYLGAVVQELAYAAGGGSLLGPRISATFGAVLAAFCCFGWLRARNTSVGVALVLALLLLSDPIFSNIYRQGRVDGFAMAAALGACWLLRAAGQRAQQSRPTRIQVFGAGLLTAASPFLWTTAPALFPLVALEAFHLARARWSKTPGVGDAFFGLVPAVLGALIAALVLAAPVLVDFEPYWAGLQSSAAVQARAAVIQNSVLDLFLVHDVGLAVLVLASVFVCREFGLFIALAAAFLIISQTMVYLPRVLYLIPYLLAIIAAAHAYLSKPGRRRLLLRYWRLLLTLNVVLCVIWVLVLRPTAAYKRWPANDPAQFTAALERSVGRGDHRVLLGAWEAYYAGRSLGWAMYRAGSPVPVAEYAAFAGTMDYAVLPKLASYRDISGPQLVDAGFVLVDEIDFAQAEPIRLPAPPFGFRFPGGGYSTIQVFENTRRQPAP